MGSRRYRQTVYATAVALIASGAAMTLSSCGSPTSSTQPSTPGEVRMILSPATVVPVVNECHEALTKTADGNSIPLSCPTGDLNVLAWNFYAPLATTVMALGRGVSASQVSRAMCADLKVNHATKNEEVNGALMASDYYGWNLSVVISTFVTGPNPSC